MSRDSFGEYGRCEATNRSEEQCGQPATDERGKCYWHGGTTPTKEENPNVGNGDQDGNGNGETHQLTADTDQWFERHREECGDDVRIMVASWMKLAPFGWEVTGNVNLLCDAAKNECQVRAGDRYIDDKGVIVKEKVAAGEGYFHKDAENPAFLYKSRLQRSTLQILNKLDILDSPESRQADATESVANLLGELNP